MALSIGINDGTVPIYNNGNITYAKTVLTCCDSFFMVGHYWETQLKDANTRYFYPKPASDYYEFTNWFDVPELDFRNKIEGMKTFRYKLYNGATLEFAYDSIIPETTDVKGTFTCYLYTLNIDTLGKNHYKLTGDKKLCFKIYNDITPYFTIGKSDYWTSNPDLSNQRYSYVEIVTWEDKNDFIKQYDMSPYDKKIYFSNPMVFEFGYGETDLNNNFIYNNNIVDGEDLYNSLFVLSDATDPNPPGGGGGDGGGTPDPTDITPPSATVLGTGALTCYKLSSATVNEVFEYLWSTDFNTASEKLYSNPIDSIISLMIVPCNASGTTAPIKIAGVQMGENGINGVRVSEQYVKYEFNPINITECFGSFLDYAPYTQISMYIPFSGMHDLNTNEIMCKSLTCGYIIDVVTGMGVAYIKTYIDNVSCIIGNYPCQMGYSIPVSGANMDSIVTTTNNCNMQKQNSMLDGLTAGASAALSIASGNVGGVLSAAGTVSSFLKSANERKAAMQNVSKGVDHAGALNGTTGLISVRQPFVMIKRPKKSEPSNFAHSNGKPSNICKFLYECTGYTEVGKIDLTGIEGATSNELNEIMQILTSGFYI